MWQLTDHEVSQYFEVFYGECASMYPVSLGKNPNFPCANDFRVVRRSDSVGNGVICFRCFEPGDLVAEFNGKLTRKITQHSLQVEPGLHLVDLHFVGYLLHSCDPNVSLDMAHRRVYAVKSIHEFDFLQMDYAQTEDVLYRQFPCDCGALNCRGWITGRQEPVDQCDPAYQEFIRSQKVVA